MKVKSKVFLIVTIFVALSNVSFGQNKSSSHSPLAAIPVDLQSDLVIRLNLFTEAQKNGQWDKVADLMGEYRNIALNERYTDKYKECVIEQIKFSPMISFTPIYSLASTAILNYSPEKRWYALNGVGEFKTEAGIITRETKFAVYRNNQNWFIYPPDYGYQWLQRNYRKDTSPEKLKAFLQVVEQPDSPLEIFDVSVKMNSKDASLRDFTFKLRNRSAKEIDLYIYEVEKYVPLIPASRSSNRSKSIMPNETVNLEDEDQRFAAYDYYCQEEQIRKIYIRWVRFTDGSEWKIDKKSEDKIKEVN